MSVYKRSLILALVGMGAAMVTALAAVGPVTKHDRAIASHGAITLPETGCPQEPWPFGCQWREGSLKVAHKSHASHSRAGQQHHPRRPHISDEFAQGN
ncbi:MAG TPA: hypothetical protein VH684_30990 [Xanthobacteraceae bacterium]|jgi:hypothetical protein